MRALSYCAYPKIAMRALIMSFALCALIVPLEMIDDLVFHNDGFQPTGINAWIALVAIYVAVFCFCALRPKFGMRGKQWLDLQNRLAVRQTQSDRSAQVAGVLATQAAGRLLQKSDNKAAQALGGAAQVAGAVGAVSTAADMLSESANNAEAMADAYGVPVPNIKKQLIAFSIVPVLVLIAIYIPCDIYSAIRPGKPGDAGEDRPRRRANRYGGKRAGAGMRARFGR